MQNPLSSLKDISPETIISGATPWFLWVIFVAALLVWIVVSGVLLFHWQRFSLNNTTVKFSRNLYFLVSGLFFLITLVSIGRL